MEHYLYLPRLLKFAQFWIELVRDVFEKLAEQSLNLMGWEIDNHWPLDLDQCVMIAAPHTSNWDALYARLALKALGVNVRLTN